MLCDALLVARLWRQSDQFTVKYALKPACKLGTKENPLIALSAMEGYSGYGYEGHRVHATFA